MKIKFLSFILICLMIIPMVIACGKKAEGETTTPAETTPVVEKILVADGKDSEYKIIKSEHINEVFQAKYLDFVEDIKKKTGTYYKLGDDFLRKDIDKSEPLEILFGATNRVECVEVYSSIGYDGYAIKHVGNKIVIAAYTAKNMVLATKAFFSECVEVVDDGSGNKKLYYVKDYVVEGSEKVFFNASNPISEYKIVYAPAEEEAAKSLAKAIKQYTYRELEVVPDSSAPTDKEILVGATNRSESNIDVTASKIGFVIKAVGSKIVVRAGANGSVANSVPVIISTYMLTSPDFNFPATLDANHTSYIGLDQVNLTEGADFRIMSFNILSEEWTEEAKDMDKRIPGVIGAILYYEPDVIGVQEISKKWYKILREYLGDTYEFINTDAAGTTDGCYTGLAYNKKKLDLVDKELYYYSVYNSKRLRVVNMGLFKFKESGKTIVVTDTHFNANHKDATTENKNRVQQATEFIAKIDEYRKKYNCPIVMTGDFNSKDGTEPYNKIMSDTLIAEAKHTALKKGSIFLTYHNLGTMPGADTASIDHIFYSGNITPLYYTTLMDQYLVIASDHCPIFADFKFN